MHFIFMQFPQELKYAVQQQQQQQQRECNANKQMNCMKINRNYEKFIGKWRRQIVNGNWQKQRANGEWRMANDEWRMAGLPST